MIQIVRSMLLLFVDDIDNGRCLFTESQLLDVLKILRFYANKEERLSRVQAARYLNMNLRTFDRHVKEGKINPGEKILGFKEKFFCKSELDKVVSH